MTTKGTDNRFRSLTVVGEAGTPATPASGDFKLYVADDGTFYVMDDTGTPTALGGGGFSDPMTTRGDIIVRNASNVTARLPIGSSGKVLSSDGTDVSWQTPASGGALVLLEQHTASSSTTLDFTSFISSTYDEYLFEFLNLVPATDNVNFWMRMGTGGGPTYDTGSNYDHSEFRHTNAASATAGSGSDTKVVLDGSGGIDNDTAWGISGSLRLFQPQAVTNPRPKFTGQFTYRDNALAVLDCIIGGSYANSAAVTAVRFLMSSGNIASGTIRVYGVAK